MIERSDKDDRRRLAVWYMACAIASTIVLQAQVVVSELARGEVLLANIAFTALIATPFISFVVLRVVGWFRSCQEAVSDPDPVVRGRAIDAALALPAKATLIYVAAWVLGMPIGMLATHAVAPMGTGDVVAYLTAFAGLIPVTGFPIYAVVERHTRPVLRKLFKDFDASGAQFQKLGSFSIARRVTVAIGSLLISAVAYLSARTIAASLGVTDASVELDSLLFEIPVLGALTIMVEVAVTTSLSGSVKEVIGTVRTAASGDLTHHGAVTTTDELGALMLDIDRMLAAQSKLIRSSTEVAREVTMSASAVADGSEQSSQGVSEIAHAMQDVVSGAQSQFEQIDVARRAADDLAGAIEQATAATAQATQISSGAHELADRGAESADQAREAMERMQRTIEEATSAVDKLGGDTADIGTIVETIVTIADQTNMLALNAAIEAARAGEMGRGFAVVAEEVRHLAGESNEAAEKIAELIKKVSQTVVQTIDAVNRGGSEVSRGVNVVDEAGEKFTGIAGALETIGSHVGAVDARISEVAHATGEVTDAVEEILRVTESVAALAEETSANTEEASASSEEITSSADALRQMAHELESQISVFTV